MERELTAVFCFLGSASLQVRALNIFHLPTFSFQRGWNAFLVSWHGSALLVVSWHSLFLTHQALVMWGCFWVLGNWHSPPLAHPPLANCQHLRSSQQNFLCLTMFRLFTAVKFSKADFVRKVIVFVSKCFFWYGKWAQYIKGNSKDTCWGVLMLVWHFSRGLLSTTWTQIFTLLNQASVFVMHTNCKYLHCNHVVLERMFAL